MPESLFPPLLASVGLSNIYYTLSLKKEARYTLGDFQPRGRMGVYTLACIALIVFAGRHLHTKKAAISGGLLLQGFGVANDDVGEFVAAHKKERRLSRSFVELLTGFEPVTSSLPRKCSTC